LVYIIRDDADVLISERFRNFVERIEILISEDNASLKNYTGSESIYKWHTFDLHRSIIRRVAKAGLRIAGIDNEGNDYSQEYFCFAI